MVGGSKGCGWGAGPIRRCWSVCTWSSIITHAHIWIYSFYVHMERKKKNTWPHFIKAHNRINKTDEKRQKGRLLRFSLVCYFSYSFRLCYTAVAIECKLIHNAPYLFFWGEKITRFIMDNLEEKIVKILLIAKSITNIIPCCNMWFRQTQLDTKYIILLNNHSTSSHLPDAESNLNDTTFLF